MLVLKTLFWGSLGALAWTHVGYPLAAAAAARLAAASSAKGRARTSRSVTVIVAAYNEEAVIERRLENLLALDYPAEQARASWSPRMPPSDRTDEIVEAVAARDPRVRLLRCPRGGKVAAQNLAVRESAGDVVAFSDANATWAPDALRRLVSNLADPDVAYVCGRLRLEAADGSNQEGRTGATSSGCATGVVARLGHRWQRLDLRAPARGLRRGRPAVRHDSRSRT